jgi:uncharacterized membrane protein (UPF0127 family)
MLVACAQSPKLPTVELSFTGTAGTHTPRFVAEICANDSERSLGLMFRKSIAETAGMIFLFEKEEEHSFWMKNTYIPLDMVFVGANQKVVGVLEDVPPHTEDPRTVGKPSLYVVELKAGTARKFGISADSTMTVHGDLPQAR